MQEWTVSAVSPRPKNAAGVLCPLPCTDGKNSSLRKTPNFLPSFWQLLEAEYESLKVCLLLIISEILESFHYHLMLHEVLLHWRFWSWSCFDKYTEAFLKHSCSWSWGRKQGPPSHEMLLVCEEWPLGMDQKWYFVANQAFQGIWESWNFIAEGTFEAI